MAAVLNAQLTAMLTALDGAAAGLGNEFVAHVGSTMAMAAAMPADWFPKTGTPTAAQIASFLMRLHDLKTIVWANYPAAPVSSCSDSCDLDLGASCLRRCVLDRRTSGSGRGPLPKVT